MDRRRRLDARDYTVGWICALPIELAAAQEMLDERDETIPDSLDPIIYTLGRIDVHNVVLACLPAGNTGTQSAATVAARMRTRFTSIRFGLMVGIGGGVPSTDLSIHLGDVVISQPHQQHGGVVQYDFGKTEAGGNTIRTGWLNAPPPVLLSAVVEQRARHMRQESALKKYLSQFARLENFSRDVAGDDVLFEATYDHVGKSTCEACSDEKIVRRQSINRRLGVGLHYGTIASGNQVMKDGVTRDKISKELGGVMCFEMEAAGLMNDFPCLVIRGICDYADSHKNKQWQPYAAATAAACAKEILSIVPGVPNVSVNKTASTSETVQDRIESKLDQIFRELRLGFKPSTMFAQDLEKELVDDNITEVDVEENKDFIKDWIEHTQEREWFGDSEQTDQSSNADSNDLSYKSEQDGHDVYSGLRSSPRIQEWMASTREQYPVDESEQAGQPTKARASNSSCGSQQDTLDGDTAGFYIDVDGIIYKAGGQSKNAAKEKGVPQDEGDGAGPSSNPFESAGGGYPFSSGGGMPRGTFHFANDNSGGGFNFSNPENIFAEFLRGQEQDDARRIAADARRRAEARQSYRDSEYDRHEYDRNGYDRNGYDRNGYEKMKRNIKRNQYSAGGKSKGSVSTEGAGPSILEPSDQYDNEDEESSEGSSPSPPVFRRSTTIPAPVYSPSQADNANKYRPQRHDHGYTGHSDRKRNGQEYLDPSQPSNVPPPPNEYVPIYEPETKTRTYTYTPMTKSKHKHVSMHEPGAKTRTYIYTPGTRSKPGYVSIDEPETKTRIYTYIPGEKSTSKYVSVNELGTTTRPYPYTSETRSTSAPFPVYDLFPHSNTVRDPLLLDLEEIFHGTTRKVVILRRYPRASGEVVRRHEVEVGIKKGFGSSAIVDIPLEIPRVGNRSGERIHYDDVRMVLQEKPHPTFTRDGDDLHHTLEINVMQSLCGWARLVTTIDGKKLQVRDDGPTPPDWEKRFSSNGMPRSTNPKERGDLVLHVKILQPKHLAEHQKNALRVALADVEY